MELTKVEKDDDIDLLLTLHPHGWSTCFLFVHGEQRRLTISHVFGDPYANLINAIRQLMDGHTEASYFWYTEPGGHRIIIERMKTQQDFVSVKIDEFNESFGDQINNFKPTITFQIKLKALIALVYFQMKKIEALLSD